MDDFDARKRREIANLAFGDDDGKRDASRAGAVDARAARTVRAPPDPSTKAWSQAAGAVQSEEN